jgi:Mg2+-importing ATPase
MTGWNTVARGKPYWTVPTETLLSELGSSPQGLTAEEAARRLSATPETAPPKAGVTRRGVLWHQIKSPLLLLLVFAAAVSAINGEWTDASIVVVIVLVSAGIGYSREYRAQKAAEALSGRLRVRATVRRDGQTTEVPREELVPGDLVILSAGSLVPADAVVIEATDCCLTQSALTGESFPVDKFPGSVAAEAGLASRSNVVYLGTNVRSGTAVCVVVNTGAATELGAVARRLTERRPETDFDRGIRRFGYLLTSAMLVMVLLVFVAQMFAHRPPAETLLFSVALAVGLSPELLPAILSINLARGAQMMARRGVLVRDLTAIENLGSMDVLCTDKTGTLTEGVVQLDGAYGPDGTRSAEVLLLAGLNAVLETGLANPLDDAILAAGKPDLQGVVKRDEMPFDFVRRRVTIVVQRGSECTLIAKGAVPNVLDACGTVAGGGALDDGRLAAIEALVARWSAAGLRTLAVATAAVPDRARYGRDDERDLTLVGFLTFLDRPKADAARAIRDLAGLGVTVKVITGDHHLVAAHVAGLVGLDGARLLTGSALTQIDDVALVRMAGETVIFAEIDPNQKARIIRALRRAGHVVGFLGDGINDAPAMHLADTSLSVEAAVDVAREAADFVLLEPDLDVIRGGVEEGRRTFANTIKYILTTTSANLGNMLSMAVASLFLPFLPLTAGQILLNNLLSDIPALGIADDSVDPELVATPPRWDLTFVGRFMVEFGLLSSVFDVLTFVLLLRGFHASVVVFRTGWFLESLLTELAVALIVRTRRLALRSRPGALLLWSTVAVAAAAFALPLMPWATVLGFTPLPLGLQAVLVGVTVLYCAATEGLKRVFYAR